MREVWHVAKFLDAVFDLRVNNCVVDMGKFVYKLLASTFSSMVISRVIHCINGVFCINGCTMIRYLLLRWYLRRQRIRARVIIWLLVQGSVRIRVRVGVRFNISVRVTREIVDGAKLTAYGRAVQWCTLPPQWSSWSSVSAWRCRPPCAGVGQGSRCPVLVWPLSVPQLHGPSTGCETPRLK